MAEQVIGDALPSEITADYDVGQTLGTGHFSKVKLGTDKKTGEKVAIKVCVSSAAALPE
jgi:serine/threonine protein kinase